MQMALAGAGIMVMANEVVDGYVKAGQLVRILPEWHMGSVVFCALFPGRRLMPARTRVFIDMLVAKFNSPDITSAARAGVASSMV